MLIIRVIDTTWLGRPTDRDESLNIRSVLYTVNGCHLTLNYEEPLKSRGRVKIQSSLLRDNLSISNNHMRLTASNLYELSLFDITSTLSVSYLLSVCISQHLSFISPFPVLSRTAEKIMWEKKNTFRDPPFWFLFQSTKSYIYLTSKSIIFVTSTICFHHFHTLI